MKIVKKILLGLVAVIVLLLVITLFIKKDYAVEREITINKPAGEIFDYIKNLKNQDYYSKWAMMDPAMKKDYRGTDGTVGFIYAWDSKEAGKGEQEIKRIAQGKQLDIEIRFEKPFESKGDVHMITEEVSPTQTKVKWGMQGRNKYPMNFMNLFMDNLLGRDLNTGLSNLKTILEK